MEMLIKHGADITIKDHEGKDAKDYIMLWHWP